jgi:hypothetical protein
MSLRAGFYELIYEAGRGALSRFADGFSAFGRSENYHHRNAFRLICIGISGRGLASYREPLSRDFPQAAVARSTERISAAAAIYRPINQVADLHASRPERRAGARRGIPPAPRLNKRACDDGDARKATRYSDGTRYAAG